jgi:hypothetical protein
MVHGIEVRIGPLAPIPGPLGDWRSGEGFSGKNGETGGFDLSPSMVIVPSSPIVNTGREPYWGWEARGICHFQGSIASSMSHPRAQGALREKKGFIDRGLLKG